MTGPDRRDVERFSDEEVARLLAAIFPTRVERVIERTANAVYGTAEGLQRLGRGLDRVRQAMQQSRATTGRHLDGRRDR